MKKHKLTSEEQALKTKIEQASFDYQEADWHNLESKLAPKKGFWSSSKILVAGLVVTAIGTTLWLNKENLNDRLQQTNNVSVELKPAELDNQFNDSQESIEKTTENSKTSISPIESETLHTKKSTESNTNKQALKPTAAQEQNQSNKDLAQIDKKSTSSEKSTNSFDEELEVDFIFDGKNCVGEQVTVRVDEQTILSHVDNYEWFLNGEQIKSDRIQIHLEADVNYKLLLKAYSENKSPLIFDTSFKANPLPKSDFEYEDLNGFFDDLIASMIATNEEVEQTYIWKFNEAEIGTKSSLKYKFKQSGSYPISLTVKSSKNCSSTTTKFVEVKEQMSEFINAFSPNNDGMNDLFMPQGFEEFEGKFNLSIYDLQGQMVYSTDSKDEPWNGTFENKGRKMPLGTYIWEIKISDTKNNYRSFKDKVKIVSFN
tara:strand:+ start:3805 stop:5088 length:1284 start_codon:yes stop_codon:yes gene_type:complete